MATKVVTEVPDWANWIAQSRGGLWRVYETKPKLLSNKGSYFLRPSDGRQMVIGKGEKNSNWRGTLIRVQRAKAMIGEG